MQFKQALKAAGLANPGRTTWCGLTPDGVPVFTIWQHEIHKFNGRWFAWWSHGGERDSDGEIAQSRKDHARAFIARATQNIGTPCRVVIIEPKFSKQQDISVAEAHYPHPVWARVVFRITDPEANQFIAELLQPEASGRGDA
jgi:hypothetical protein